MGATRKDFASDLNKQGATPTASVVPKTPQECVLQAQTYLMAMNPAVDDPRHEFHRDILQGLSIAREELNQKEKPRVTVASKVERSMIRPFCIIFCVIIYRYSLIYFVFEDDTYVISPVLHVLQ